MPEKKSTSTSVAENAAGGRDLGRASYSALQAQDAVMVFAFGWHPTPGYTDFFEQSPIDIFPPEFIFHSIPPFVPVPQVLTPFAIWVMFGATEPVKNVTVHDADGPHEVPVEQVSKTLGANQPATWVSGHVVRGPGIGARPSTLGLGEEEPGPTTWVLGEEDLGMRGPGIGARPSTLGLGEEEPGPTTWVLGEEDLGMRGPGIGARPSTLGLGEEEPGPTTFAIGEEDFRAATTMATGEEGGGGPTTMATGEETITAPTTMATGEEGGGPTTMATGEEAVATTLALGEEGTTTLRATPTTLAVGEETATTDALGEEGPTTLALGEENPTTDAVGEEGPTTLALGEETTAVVRSSPFGIF